MIADPVAADLGATGRPAADPPFPAGRLAVPAGVLEALTAPLAFLSPPTPAAATPPAPVQADARELPAAPPSATTSQPTTASDPLASIVTKGRSLARRMFDSPMQVLSHLMPATPNALAMPESRPHFTQLWSQHAWPFQTPASQQIKDSIGIAAVVVAALVAMTALTVAGAGLSGRSVRHSAWRARLRRGRQASDWDAEGMVPASSLPPPRRPTQPDPAVELAARAAIERDAAEHLPRRRRVA